MRRLTHTVAALLPLSPPPGRAAGRRPGLTHAVAAVLLLSLAACAGPAAPSTSQPGEAPGQSGGPVERPPADDAPAGVYQNPGQELTDYYDAFDRVLDAHEQAINDFETDDYDLLYSISVDYYSLALPIVDLAMYDDGSGALLCPDCGYFRQVDGAVVIYGKSYAREEGSFNPLEQAGDVITEGGTLDTSSNTLFEESKVERAGEVVSRTVTEVILLSEGSAVIQVFQLPLKSDKSPTENVGTALLARIDADRMDLTVAQFPRDPDFTYRSIAGDPGATVEDMSHGLTPIRQVTVAAGVATATKF
jgi:hypothetical protein